MQTWLGTCNLRPYQECDVVKLLQFDVWPGALSRRRNSPQDFRCSGHLYMILKCSRVLPHHVCFSAQVESEEGAGGTYVGFDIEVRPAISALFGSNRAFVFTRSRRRPRLGSRRYKLYGTSGHMLGGKRGFDCD